MPCSFGRCRLPNPISLSLDGESNWLEGLQLLGLYGILAIAFYMIPG